MADDFYAYDDDEKAPKGRDNLFLWTVFILLLIGVAFACWLGSFYIFGHPEQPRSYRLLQKLKKIDPPRRFEVTAAPQGEFSSPQKLYERYANLTRLELERENANLIRDYIKNYRETKKLVPYVTGRFNIIGTIELTAKDMFASGVVTLAQSIDFPKVLIEHVYTTPAANVPALRAMLGTGLDMPIKRTDDCAAVIHVAKMADGRLKFTVVSLLYGTYVIKGGTGMFSLEPPPDLNMEAGVPVLKDQPLQDAIKAYAEYRRKHPVASVEPGTAVPPTQGPELVRIDTVEPGTPVPETGAVAAVPVATPIPIRGNPTPKLIAAATPRATPPLLTMLTTPSPRVATPIPVATPMPVETPVVSPTGVTLKPFNPQGEVVARPDPSKTFSDGGKWRTYAPGAAPQARSITPDDAGALADRGAINEPIYLRGSFRVTATGVSRAVLRDASKPDEQSPRIVVEYPAGFVPPGEKEIFARDAARPFLVYDVRRGADGSVTIYAREITQQ